MSVATQDSGGTRIVTVTEPRIDAALAIRFKDDMRTATKDAPDRIILDLAGVEFVDSSGLGAIVGSMKQLGGGQRLDLAGLTPLVEKVFRLTRMDAVFRIYPSVDQAMRPDPD